MVIAQMRIIIITSKPPPPPPPPPAHTTSPYFSTPLNKIIFFQKLAPPPPPPFCNYIFNNYSTNKVENYTYNCNLCFAIGKYFLQLLTNNVKKYQVESEITIESVCHVSTPQQ